MGPHYPTRFEQYHGLDKHPNGVPPEPEDPGFRKWLPLLKCPNCMGKGGHQHREYLYGGHFDECRTCDGVGKVTIPEFFRYTVEGLKSLFRSLFN